MYMYTHTHTHTHTRTHTHTPSHTHNPPTHTHISVLLQTVWSSGQDCELARNFATRNEINGVLGHDSADNPGDEFLTNHDPGAGSLARPVDQ